MDNQHRKIAGYRELSAEEIEMVNAVKAFEASFLGLLRTVQNHLDAQNREVDLLARHYVAEPRRWAAIAKTHVQEGASALVRAITQPT